MQFAMLGYVRACIYLLVSAVGLSEAANAQSFGDYTLKYGYAYYTPSHRSSTAGGIGARQKLPGELKFVFSDKVDMFVRSDTIKATHDGPLWHTGAGDTVTGLDLVLLNSGYHRPEIDFTYDAKLPTSGFASGLVDHEMILSFLKARGRQAFEADLGDYMEGFAAAPYAHSFELTLSDEFGLGHGHHETYRVKLVPEIDFTSRSPDTPTELYELVRLKYKFSDRIMVAPGVRYTDTPYSSRFSAFVTLYVSGSLVKRGKQAGN